METARACLIAQSGRDDPTRQARPPLSIGAAAHVPPSYPAAWPAAFAVVPSVTNSTAPVTFDRDFGDGTPHSSSHC